MATNNNPGHGAARNNAANSETLIQTKSEQPSDGEEEVGVTQQLIRTFVHAPTTGILQPTRRNHVLFYSNSPLSFKVRCLTNPNNS